MSDENPIIDELFSGITKNSQKIKIPNKGISKKLPLKDKATLIISNMLDQEEISTKELELLTVLHAFI